ncbi:MAG TPA: hypothetical protein VNI52_08865 [Sphingobacteriaceae bacterium]|nr:hypothetical protein [Sphingobacteriaceae bacterium]
MIKTSTPLSTNLYSDKADEICASELTEDDELFYSNYIQPALNLIAADPANKTVDYLICYSRSL